MKLVKIYQQLNQGKERKLVFQLTRRGFGSEINNMLLAMLYCLVYDIEFILYSRSWSASNNAGWKDYFLPFCKEYRNLLFYRRSVYKPLYRLNTFFLSRKFLRVPYDLYDVWEDMRSTNFLKKRFSIPELGINGGIFHAKKALFEMIYRHNNEINQSVQSHNKLLNDITPYVSLHIRRGDKVAKQTKEAKPVDLSKYIEQIKKNAPSIDTIFIATDDYREVKEFKKICPSQWRVITFCKPNQVGYIQKKFNRNNKEARKQSMIDLFVDIHFIKESQFFIGTYSSNLGRLVALFKGKNKCYSVDTKNWPAR